MILSGRLYEEKDNSLSAFGNIISAESKVCHIVSNLHMQYSLPLICASCAAAASSFNG